LLRTLITGSRSSQLARRQTDLVITLLQAAWPELEVQVKVYSTRGDRDVSSPLPAIGGKGVFTAEIETGLRRGEIHLAVHSLKDLPTSQAGSADDLCIAATPLRGDARDALISRYGLPLARLPAAPRIGTCSPRRAAQIVAARPDAIITPLRGNVDTRLRKAMTPDYDAIVLAAVGLVRLEAASHVTEWLPFDVMLPAAGQGALAVQCRVDDAETLALLRPIHHSATWAAVSAERAFLAALGGGCAAPAAAYAEITVEETGRPVLRLRGLVASPVSLPGEDRIGEAASEPAAGPAVVRVEGVGSPDQPERLGRRLAEEALAAGGRAILQTVHEANPQGRPPM